MARHGIDRHDATAVSAFVLHALELWLAHGRPRIGGLGRHDDTDRTADLPALIDVIVAHYDTLY